MKVYILTSLTLLLLSCQSKVEETRVKNVQQHPKEEISKSSDSVTINGAIGIITTSKDYQFGDRIDILDAQGKPFKQITIAGEYQPMVLECLSFDLTRYKIKLETGVEAYIQKSNPYIKFNTWSQHILNNVFSVGFDSKGNPLKSEPADSSSSLNYEADAFYHPAKINDDWLQVKWGDDDRWKYGWIKWKYNGKLLIRFFYFA